MSRANVHVRYEVSSIFLFKLYKKSLPGRVLYGPEKPIINMVLKMPFYC